MVQFADSIASDRLSEIEDGGADQMSASMKQDIIISTNLDLVLVERHNDPDQ